MEETILAHLHHFEAMAIIPVGHIAEDCPRTEKKRKAIEEIVEEIWFFKNSTLLIAQMFTDNL